MPNHWKYADPSLRRSGVGNVFVRGLDPQITNKMLHDAFSHFGHIISCKIQVDDTGKSRGVGFVHFSSNEEAANAIAAVDSNVILSSSVRAEKWLPPAQRKGITQWTNLYVRGVPSDWTEETMKVLFQEYGTDRKSVV